MKKKELKLSRNYIIELRKKGYTESELEEINRAIENGKTIIHDPKGEYSNLSIGNKGKWIEVDPLKNE